MPFLPQPDPTAGFAPLALLEKRLGFVPALFRAQTLLPRVLEAEAALAEALLFAPSPLPRLKKERLLLTVASSLGSTYCVTAHHRLLIALGDDDDQLRELATSPMEAEVPPDEAAMLDFALRLAWRPERVTAGHVQALRDAGLTDEAALDVVLTTALTRFLCCMASGLGVDPDFAPPAWHDPASSPPRFDDRPLPQAEERPQGRFPAPEIDPGSFAPFQIFQRSFGFIPRIFRAQTSRPDVVAAEADAVRLVLLTEDHLARVQKESILLVVSALNLNTYCVAVHCEMLRALGVDEERSDRIAVNHQAAGLDARDVVLLDFSRKLAQAPGTVTGADIDSLRRHGFSETQALEAIVMVALTQFLNTLQMGLGVSPDFPPRREFAPRSEENLNRDERSAHPKDDEDRPLVERARSGDLDAFESLVRRHDRRVYRTLMGVLGSPEDAEDALQNVFLKVHAGLGNFRGDARFSTWITRIAINEGLMKLRARRPMETLDEVAEQREAHAAHEMHAWEDDPERLYSLAERRALVERALAALPPLYRTAVVLRDIEQLDTEEAAAALSIPVATLKTRLFRGRLMLRDALAPHFEVARQGGARA